MIKVLTTISNKPGVHCTSKLLQRVNPNRGNIILYKITPQGWQIRNYHKVHIHNSVLI